MAVLGEAENGEAAGDALNTLSRKLLGVAQRLKLDPQTADLNRLVAEMVQHRGFANGSDVALEVIEGAGLWDVLIDKEAFSAALSALPIRRRSPAARRVASDSACCDSGDVNLVST